MTLVQPTSPGSQASGWVGGLVGRFTFQQHAGVSQGRIDSDKYTRRHTDTEVADQTCYLTKSHYTDTKPTSPSPDPITLGVWQDSHGSSNLYVTSWIGHTPRKPASNITRQALDWNPQGKRKVGRPKQTWRRSTDAEIKAAGTTWAELRRTSQNRVRWRGAVAALCSARNQGA